MRLPIGKQWNNGIHTVWNQLMNNIQYFATYNWTFIVWHVSSFYLYLRLSSSAFLIIVSHFSNTQITNELSHQKKNQMNGHKVGLNVVTLFSRFHSCSVCGTSKWKKEKKIGHTQYQRSTISHFVIQSVILWSIYLMIVFFDYIFNFFRTNARRTHNYKEWLKGKSVIKKLNSTLA